MRVDAETHGTFEEITRAVTQQTHVLRSTQAYLEPIRNSMQKTIGGLPVMAQKPNNSMKKTEEERGDKAGCYKTLRIKKF